MALQTKTTIKIGETVITNFSRLKIHQKIHAHHTFSFEIRQDILVDEFKSALPVCQQFYGEKISIEIRPEEGLDELLVGANQKDYIMQFYGLVTRVKLKKSNIKDMEETILVKGCSASILLENGPESNSFAKMPLADIVKKIQSGYDIDIDIKPFYQNNLSYTVQYNESCFNFLNRLAKRYGQWFYDNGTKMIFGNPGSFGGQPKLLYGVNMQEFSYGIKVLPSAFKILENDIRTGDYSADNTLRYQKETDGFHQNLLSKSTSVFNKETVIQLNQNAAEGNGTATKEEYTKNKMRSVLSKMIQIKGSSEVPGITIGNTVAITGVDKQLESTYHVTQIVHTCDDGGGYENQFTAINFNGSMFSPKTNPDLVPRCKSQTAVVTANADPDGLSGVQVQMPWQKEKGETTPFIPLLQKYGGDARGSHIIPEIGDTVFVDFQSDNAELPIVVGTMTSNKEKSGYSTPNNDLKVMRTRSGILLVLNDADGSALVEDPSGNRYFMDGNGNIKLLAPKNIEIEAGEDIVMKAGRDLKIDSERDITQIAGRDISMLAAEDIKESADNKTESITDSYTRSSHESTQFAQEVKIISSKENMLLESSEKTVEINSKEKTNFF